jgi:hypothetical protein
MPYLAQVSGTTGNYSISVFQEGSLSSIAPSQQANWRQVVEQYNPSDPVAQIRGTPTFSVSSDGSTVTMIWNPLQMPSFWAVYQLKQYAYNKAQGLFASGVILPNGVSVATSDHAILQIVMGALAAQLGIVSGSVPAPTSTGWATLASSDLTNLFGGIFQRGVAILNAWQAISAAIDAGSITTQAQIDAYAWPA